LYIEVTKYANASRIISTTLIKSHQFKLSSKVKSRDRSWFGGFFLGRNEQITVVLNKIAMDGKSEEIQ